MPGVSEHSVYIVGPGVGRHPTLFVSSYVKSKRQAAQFQANAEFIVRACNTHDEMLEALRQAKDWLDEVGCDCGTGEPGTCASCLVDAAIVKAEGKATVIGQ